MQQAVAYYRVSTQQQGRSGLGLEAQKKAVERFAAAEGFEVARNFVEVESGVGVTGLPGVRGGAPYNPPITHRAKKNSRGTSPRLGR